MTYNIHSLKKDPHYGKKQFIKQNIQCTHHQVQAVKQVALTYCSRGEKGNLFECPAWGGRQSGFYS